MIKILVQSSKVWYTEWRTWKIRGRVETIETTAFLRSAKILGRVLETWGDLLSLKLQRKTISWRWREKLDHTNKWYMLNPASVQENDTHKLLWDFDIQMDHLISARKPDLIIINNKKRELSKLSTLPTRLTTELNWKNVKWRISSSTLLENWKKIRTWRWQLYQL